MRIRHQCSNLPRAKSVGIEISLASAKTTGDAGVDLGGLSIKGAASTSDAKGKEKEAPAKADAPRRILRVRRVERRPYT